MEDQDKLRATAYHESAHAVVAYVLRCPRLLWISIVPEPSGSAGHCTHKPWPQMDRKPWLNPSADHLFRLHDPSALSTATAANLAEARLCYDQACERNQDVPPLDLNAIDRDRLKRDMCVFLAGQEGARLVMPTYLRARAADDLYWARELSSQITDDPTEHHAILRRQTQRARRILNRNRYALDVLARTLIETRRIRGITAEALIAAAMPRKR